MVEEIDFPEREKIDIRFITIDVLEDTRRLGPPAGDLQIMQLTAVCTNCTLVCFTFGRMRKTHGPLASIGSD